MNYDICLGYFDSRNKNQEQYKQLSYTIDDTELTRVKVLPTGLLFLYQFSSLPHFPSKFILSFSFQFLLFRYFFFKSICFNLSWRILPLVHNHMKLLDPIFLLFFNRIMKFAAQYVYCIPSFNYSFLLSIFLSCEFFFDLFHGCDYFLEFKVCFVQCCFFWVFFAQMKSILVFAKLFCF